MLCNFRLFFFQLENINPERWWIQSICLHLIICIFKKRPLFLDLDDLKWVLVADWCLIALKKTQNWQIVRANCSAAGTLYWHSHIIKGNWLQLLSQPFGNWPSFDFLRPKTRNCSSASYSKRQTARIHRQIFRFTLRIPLILSFQQIFSLEYIHFA